MPLTINDSTLTVLRRDLIGCMTTIVQLMDHALGDCEEKTIIFNHINAIDDHLVNLGEDREAYFEIRTAMLHSLQIMRVVLIRMGDSPLTRDVGIIVNDAEAIIHETTEEIENLVGQSTEEQ